MKVRDYIIVTEEWITMEFYRYKREPLLGFMFCLRELEMDFFVLKFELFAIKWKIEYHLTRNFNRTTIEHDNDTCSTNENYI